MTTLQPGQMLGPYQIINQIGKGGMATVYKAYHAAMDRYVALKVVATQLADDPNFLQRFRREARLIAKLEHPHILPVHDFGEAEGIPYMVMRYLDAGTLKERLESGTLPVKEIDRIFSQLADALEYAHENGVIHRDIKPSNAMLDKRGDVFLTDFGVAKMLEGTSGLTATGTVTGTPAYMSPEQAQGLKVDQRSDIYSLGIVLFEMLTGHVPFEAETPMAVLFKQIQDPPPPLSIVRPDLPYTFEAVLLKAMAKNPDERYASMHAFREGWKNALEEATTLHAMAPATMAPSAATLPPAASTVSAPPATVIPAMATVAAEKVLPPTPSVETAPQTAAAPKRKFPFAALAIGGVLVVLLIGAFLALRFIRTRQQRLQANHATQTASAAVRNLPPTAPPAPPTEAPPAPTEITLWYTYASGSAEYDAMQDVLKRAAANLPAIKIKAEFVAFDSIFTKYRAEVSSGGGPDLFIAPNDDLGNDVRAGLVASLSEMTQGKLKGYSDVALNGMTVDGKLYGIPESLKTVAFWYDKTKLPNPPHTTAELKELMTGGTPIAIGYGCYYQFGFYGAFGGQLFDKQWRFVADQGKGYVEALAYLNSLYRITRKNGWPRSDLTGPQPFISGQVVAMINGNWLAGDLRRALGDRLAVVPLPAGPGGPSTPLVGVDGYYLNPKSTKKEAALQLALYLTNVDAQRIMLIQGGHLPTRTDMVILDPLMNGMLNTIRNGYFRPQVPQMSKYWANFCNTDDIYERGVLPTTWVKAATAAANK
jgi:maltose-binding protein MalE/tRNA A-37 threonylcarbamoyl transferase component Bud32